MDSNIRTGGEAIKESAPAEDKRGKVAWIANIDSECGSDTTCYPENTNGPITAINYLKEATKNWTNTNEIKIDTITNDAGTAYTIPNVYYSYARMPYFSEISSITGNKTWLVDYMDSSLDNDSSFNTNNITGRNGVSNVYEYWLLSIVNDDKYFSYRMMFMGSISSMNSNSNEPGVRPVISLKLKEA